MAPPSIDVDSSSGLQGIDLQRHYSDKLEKHVVSFHKKLTAVARSTPRTTSAEDKEKEAEEDMLSPEHAGRFLTFPPTHEDMFHLWQKLLGVSWTLDEVPFHDDRATWTTLPLREKIIVIKMMVFFLHGDHALAVASSEELGQMVTPFEMKAFYAQQSANEMLHVQTYSEAVVSLLGWCTPEERTEIEKHLDVLNSPATKSKMEWALQWSRDNGSLFSELLLAYALVEGVMFASSFCIIFYYRSRGILPGTQTLNKLISIDEGIHTDGGCAMYTKLKRRLPRSVVEEMVTQAVDAEIQFVDELLDEPLRGLDKKDMAQYVKHIADRLLRAIGENPIYRVDNPLEFMDAIGLPVGTNFLEKRPSEYITTSQTAPNKIDMDVDDF